MTPLKMGSRRVEAPTAELVAARSTALGDALQAGGAQLDIRAAGVAREIIARTRTRVSLGGDHTVVALAGATGSGKSSLFNALTR
ncbi:MAG: ABC transporter, partial [Lapillicoccus sp.]